MIIVVAVVIVIIATTMTITTITTTTTTTIIIDQKSFIIDSCVPIVNRICNYQHIVPSIYNIPWLQ